MLASPDDTSHKEEKKGVKEVTDRIPLLQEKLWNMTSSSSAVHSGDFSPPPSSLLLPVMENSVAAANNDVG